MVEVILADNDGKEIRYINPISVDIDLSDTKDFEITINANEYDSSFAFGNRIFIPSTEYGGVIGAIETNTLENKIILKGYCWRGMLSKHIITPPSGQDYYTVSGELNSIIKNLTSDLTSVFITSSENTMTTVSDFQFDRYCTLLEGLEKLLKSRNYRLDIKYVQGVEGVGGYVLLSAVPIADYSKDIQFSQDNNINFIFENVQNGVNHLICLGSGELKDRAVIDLYVNNKNKIVTTQYYIGNKEVTEVYDDNNSSGAELKENGTEKLKELMNTKSFNMDLSTLNVELSIGDVVGGRDYVTGFSLSTPDTNKIYKMENGKVSIDYEIKGEEE